MLKNISRAAKQKKLLADHHQIFHHRCEIRSDGKMAANPKVAGRQAKTFKQSKTDLRQQKRKRDQDDLGELAASIEELVRTTAHARRKS